MALPVPRHVAIRVSPSQVGASGGGWAGSSTDAKVTSTDEVLTVHWLSFIFVALLKPEIRTIPLFAVSRSSASFCASERRYRYSPKDSQSLQNVMKFWMYLPASSHHDGIPWSRSGRCVLIMGSNAQAVWITHWRTANCTPTAFHHSRVWFHSLYSYEKLPLSTGWAILPCICVRERVCLTQFPSRLSIN